MKKLSKLIIFILPLFFVSANIVDQTARDVYWVHGMGGDYNSMKTLDDYSRDIFRMVSFRPEYATDQGIYGSAGLLMDELTSSRSDGENIFVAHSMGGVNSRALLDDHPGYFGGIITLGTPHAGAPIADNIDNGVLDNFIEVAVDKGSKGVRSEPIISFLSVFPTPLITIVSHLFRKKYYTLRPFMEELPREMVYEEAKNTVQSTATKNSLKTNSTDIRRLKSKTLRIPNIAIWGNEDYPTFLRLVSSRKSGKDSELVKVINGLVDVCNAKMNYHKYLKYAFFIRYSYHKARESDWRTSRDYWNGEFQKGCDKLIGANTIRYKTITYSDYVCVDRLDQMDFGMYIEPDMSAYMPYSTSVTCQLVTKTRTVPYSVILKSDGLLPEDTQKAMPGCDIKLEAQHCNHDELKYHGEVTLWLDKIFKGEVVAPENERFFMLTKK